MQFAANGQDKLPGHEPQAGALQLDREALGILHHAEVTPAKDASHIIVVAGIQGDAVRLHSGVSRFNDRSTGVLGQIARFMYIDVRRRAVRDQQNGSLQVRLILLQRRGLAQGRAHACRVARLDFGDHAA